MFLLESPQQGDSNEYTQYTIFSIRKKISFYHKSASMGFFQCTQEYLETAVVNEQSVSTVLWI